MNSTSFETDVVWIPDDEARKHLKDLKSNVLQWKHLKDLRKFLNKKCSVKVEILDVKQRTEALAQSTDSSKKEIHKKINVQEEIALNVQCRFEFERKFSIESKKFINLFCTSGNTISSEIWLKFDLSLLSDISTIKTIDKFVDLDKFSLGNIIGLNTFVEHFDSLSLVDSTDYKITNVKVKLLHDNRRLEVYFFVCDTRIKQKNSLKYRMFKLYASYTSINRVLINDTKAKSDKEGRFSVFFHFLQVPLLYAVIQKEEEINCINYDGIDQRTTWVRQVDLFEGCPPHYRKELSMNTVLKLDFKERDYDVLVPLKSYCKNVEIGITPMLIVPFVKEKTIGSNMCQLALGQLSDSLKKEKEKQIIDFDCYYALQCILTHSYNVYDQVTVGSELKEVNTFLKNKCDENGLALTEALLQIYSALIKGSIVLFYHDLKILYERFANGIFQSITETTIEKNNNEEKKRGCDGGSRRILLIKKAFFTPTHIQFVPPIPTLRNRALLHSDYRFSMRVAIRDIDSRSLNFTLQQGFSDKGSCCAITFFNKYVKNPLLKGVKIGKRKYEFVGGSTSQLRSHGLWFYALDREGKTAKDVRKSFGDMTMITEVPKFMARMGQTFSQAVDRIDVPQDCTNIDNPEKDITGGVKVYLVLNDQPMKDNNMDKKFLSELCSYSESDTEGSSNAINSSPAEDSDDEEPYTFSDGIGRISQEIADQIYKKLELEEGNRPSAMQIRYAGCKGMLVVDPTIKGKKIFFRESMKKFDSADTSLEILTLSEKSILYLNRPFVTILEQLGISKEVFLELQRDMIQDHVKAMFYEKDAMNFLNENSVLRLDYRSMYFGGLKLTEDPLFRAMIFAIFKRQIELLKTKARIKIPVNSGRTMLGVLDETFTLNYGEVFIQYSDWDTDEPKIIEDYVTVTKNPCMHPGDVRMFKAVDVKALRHIKDCIVFPAKGHRPHPDEMAGSDLDGDSYSVLWMKEISFENKDPMHYAVKKKKKKNDERPPIEPDQEMDHLRNYILNDNVGIFANAHLAFADQSKWGIFDMRCLELAKMYSLALDFIKSGIPVQRDFRYTPQTYPDFMEKLGEKNTYLSRKANGCLYRNCKRLELGLEGTKDTREFCMDEDLIYESWKKYEKSANRSLKNYIKSIGKLMETYRCSEAEMLAGILNNVAQGHHDRHDFDNTLHLVANAVKFVFNDFKNDFFHEFGGEPKDGVYIDDMCRKASAWYVVTYTQKSKDDCLYLGMPWSISNVLIYIKLNHSESFDLPARKSNQSFIEKAIDNNVADQLADVNQSSNLTIIHENRFQVLDVAYDVLKKWSQHQEEYLLRNSIDAMKNCLSAEFNSLTGRIMNCDEKYIETLTAENQLKQVLSPGYYVIRTLLQISKIGTSQDRNAGATDELQEIGLFAWITLTKLACTANTHHLGIGDESGTNAPSNFYSQQDDFVEIIQLPLFDGKSKDNDMFSDMFLHDNEEIENYLIDNAYLKGLSMRTELKSGKCYIRIVAQGTRIAIQRLKDIVVMDNFFKDIVKKKPVTYQIQNRL